jgi:hypothetical protein
MSEFAYSMISKTFPIQKPRRYSLFYEEPQHIDMLQEEQKLTAENFHVATGEARV